MTSLNLNVLLVAICLAVTQDPPTVPEDLKTVARAAPLEFVMALAHNGIPAGIDGTVSAEGTHAAARKVFVAIRPGLAGPLLNALRSDDRGTIVLDGSGSPSVIDALDQIVTQDGAGPWRAWVVVTRKEGDNVNLVSFGFIGKDGSRRTQGLATSR